MQDNYSLSHKKYIRKQKLHHITIVALRIFIAVAFIALWEITTKIGLIDSFIFSSPSRMIKCFAKLSENGMIYRHMWITIYETLICFAVVISVAFLVASLMWWNRGIFEVLEPFLVLLNSLPKSALAPVLIVWLGNDVKTIIVAAVSVAVFGAILSIYTGFIETDAEKIKLIKTLGGTKKHILFLLVIPSSLPVIINTMKVNLGLSLVGVIIGEFLAAKEGLGYLIIYGSQVFKMDWVLLSIVILAILSVVLYLLIRLAEKKWASSK